MRQVAQIATVGKPLQFFFIIARRLQLCLEFAYALRIGFMFAYASLFLFICNWFHDMVLVVLVFLFLFGIILFLGRSDIASCSCRRITPNSSRVRPRF